MKSFTALMYEQLERHVNTAAAQLLAHPTTTPPTPTQPLTLDLYLTAEQLPPDVTTTHALAAVLTAHVAATFTALAVGVEHRFSEDAYTITLMRTA